MDPIFARGTPSFDKMITTFSASADTQSKLAQEAIEYASFFNQFAHPYPSRTKSRMEEWFNVDFSAGGVSQSDLHKIPPGTDMYNFRPLGTGRGPDYFNAPRNAQVDMTGEH